MAEKKEFPKLVYHAELGHRRVEDEEALEALGSGWGEKGEIMPSEEKKEAAPQKKKAKSKKKKELVSEEMTVEELHDYCHEKGLHGYSELNKADLIKAINNGELEQG